MSAERKRLPHRRPAVTGVVEVFGNPLSVTAGFDPATGLVREIFFSGAKSGSAVDQLTQDAAVVISVALQHGVPVAALAHSVARVPGSDDTANAFATASPIGAALDWLLNIGGPQVEL